MRGTSGTWYTRLRLSCGAASQSLLIPCATPAASSTPLPANCRFFTCHIVGPTYAKLAAHQVNAREYASLMRTQRAAVLEGYQRQQMRKCRGQEEGDKVGVSRVQVQGRGDHLWNTTWAMGKALC